jgi:protein-L-isoaspartate(D-aspartate) O-methyltransferase
MQRRTFLTLSAAAAASAALPFPARAAVPKPYSWDVSPPMDNATAFVKWMEENRGESATYLRARFDRFQNMVGHVDLWETRNKRAFLLTPREEFLPKTAPSVVYDVNYHDIGYGVTITGPRVVGPARST